MNLPTRHDILRVLPPLKNVLPPFCPPGEKKLATPLLPPCFFQAKELLADNIINTDRCISNGSVTLVEIFCVYFVFIMKFNDCQNLFQFGKRSILQVQPCWKLSVQLMQEEHLWKWLFQ